MNTNFEILPFPAALLASAEVSAEEGVQGERFSRGMGRAARPAAPRGRPGGKGAARKGYGAGIGATLPVSKIGKTGRAGGVKGMGAGTGAKGAWGAGNAAAWPQGPHRGPHQGQHQWPHRRPHYWPHGWLGGYGFWPAGVAVYEPDWLALADAPPGDGLGQDAGDGRDDGDGGDGGNDGDGFGDSGEYGFGG